MGFGSGSLALGPEAASASVPRGPSPAHQTRKILIAGGGFGTAFIRYMAELTGKDRPRLCYLPTASTDGPDGITRWYQQCAPLNVEARHQEEAVEPELID